MLEQIQSKLRDGGDEARSCACKIAINCLLSSVSTTRLQVFGVALELCQYQNLLKSSDLAALEGLLSRMNTLCRLDLLFERFLLGMKNFFRTHGVLDVALCPICMEFWNVVDEDEIIICIPYKFQLIMEEIPCRGYRTRYMRTWKKPMVASRMLPVFLLSKAKKADGPRPKFSLLDCSQCNCSYVKSDFRFFRNGFYTEAKGRDTKEQSEFLNAIFRNQLSASIRRSQLRCVEELIPTAFASSFNYYKFGSVVDEFHSDAVEIAKHTAHFQQQASELSKDKSQLLKLIKYIDLTTCAGVDTRSRVVALVDRALAPLENEEVSCAAVFIYPQRVKEVCKHLQSLRKSFNVASVAAGFQSGQYHVQSTVLEVELTVADGASEIDIVISMAAAIDGDWKTVHDEVEKLKKACGSAHLKTVLATGELGSLDNVYKASWASILAGSDFIKTSTGKESVDASLEYAYVMCQGIQRWYSMTKKKIGFGCEASTPEEALSFVSLIKEVLGEEWLRPELFRIGASSLLEKIIAQL